MLRARRRRLGAGLGRLLPRRHPHARATASSTRWARCRCSSTTALRLSQSGVILDYLSQRFRDFAPQVRGGAPRGPALDALGQPQVHLRTSPPALPDELRARGEDATRASSPGSEGRAGNALTILDRHLFDRQWVAADRVTTADLSCVGYLYFDDEFGHDARPTIPTSSAGATRSQRFPAGSIPTT